jgi:hypothetical protein
VSARGVDREKERDEKERVLTLTRASHRWEWSSASGPGIILRSRGKVSTAEASNYLVTAVSVLRCLCFPIEGSAK